jgi:hypothetical protein
MNTTTIAEKLEQDIKILWEEFDNQEEQQKHELTPEEQDKVCSDIFKLISMSLRQTDPEIKRVMEQSLLELALRLEKKAINK